MIVGFMNRRRDKIERNGAAAINRPDNGPAGQTKNRLIGGKIRGRGLRRPADELFARRNFV